MELGISEWLLPPIFAWRSPVWGDPVLFMSWAGGGQEDPPQHHPPTPLQVFGPNSVQEDRGGLLGRWWCWTSAGRHWVEPHVNSVSEAAGSDLDLLDLSLKETRRSWEAELARTRPECDTSNDDLDPEDFVVNVSCTLNLLQSTNSESSTTHHWSWPRRSSPSTMGWRTRTPSGTCASTARTIQPKPSRFARTRLA